MSEPSTKPYLIRAIHQWCMDAGYTPYIAVVADDTVRVPREFVKNGEIVLNISPLATNRLALGNEAIEFQARFGGVAREVFVPMDRVLAVYARENGQGMAFEVARDAAAPAGMEEARPPVAPVALVPVAGPATEAIPAAITSVRPPPDDTPPPRGERPKLTRIK
jgi:stringent starvation protein B